MRSYPLYIDGQDREGDGWTYVVRASALIRDPEAAFNLKRRLELGEGVEPSADVIGRCAWGGDEHNRLALEAARRASAAYAGFPLDTRKQIMLDFHAAVLERAEEFVQLLIAEGHPRRLAEWEVGGVLRGSDPPTAEWYVEQFHRRFDTAERRLELVRKPDGVVCVNPPQNAAGSNAALGVMAVVAGNAVVVKAPRTTPLSVMFVFRDLLAPILERHGAPAGTVNVISGSTQRILRQWLRSPLVDDILFFGDSATGLKLGADCVNAGKKPVLELSGNDGFLVWRDADLPAAAAALTECFYGSSQICMVPKYAIVHPDVADRFLELFLERVATVRPGYPEDPEALLSPVLKADRYFDFLGEAREAGCDVLTGGRRIDVDGEPSATGFFLEPAVVRVDGLATARELSAVREETFFPLLPVVVPEPAPDRDLSDRLIAFLNANAYGLRNSIWVQDPKVAEAFSQTVGNGGLLKINDSHIGFVSYLATHGGTGRTGGPYGELNYVGLRTTHMQGIVWGTGAVEPLESLRPAA
jgi:acyl-CoA reductase-like NAD-dependent aldehyde dehydrogenase